MGRVKIVESAGSIGSMRRAGSVKNTGSIDRCGQCG